MPSALVEELKHGLDAPICLTWELTYGCNLACIHCLSSSGRRDPNELSTAEAMAVIDELREMQVFYVNIGGGEPTIRSDFYDLLDYAVGNGVGVKFSTNGSTITPTRAARLAGTDYVDVQISIDGAVAATNDAVRGDGSYAMARRAMDHLAAADFGPFKISVVVTRHNMTELDALQSLADGYGAQLRLTRLRPSGRGADHLERAPPDRRSADRPLPVAAGRIRTRSPATRSSISRRSAIRSRASTSAAPVASSASSTRSATCMRARSCCTPSSEPAACAIRAASPRCGGRRQLFESLREPEAAGACASCGSYDACQGGCMAAKFFTGLPLDGPDPECVRGHGELALLGAGSPAPRGPDHSVPVRLVAKR